jgi:hypothetical protein
MRHGSPQEFLQLAARGKDRSDEKTDEKTYDL